MLPQFRGTSVMRHSIHSTPHTICIQKTQCSSQRSAVSKKQRQKSRQQDNYSSLKEQSTQFHFIRRMFMSARYE
uniref:Uncharacterized protein n=1 Tax=Anguilla anguilla TaxID=7936 RepID=A0A0E9SEU2_ANGAN